MLMMEKANAIPEKINRWYNKSVFKMKTQSVIIQNQNYDISQHSELEKLYYTD